MNQKITPNQEWHLPFSFFLAFYIYIKHGLPQYNPTPNLKNQFYIEQTLPKGIPARSSIYLPDLTFKMLCYVDLGGTDSGITKAP